MSKTKITGKKLAIQLGREDTRIALLGSGAEILHSVTVQTPDGAVEDGNIRNPDAVREMLKTVLKAPELKKVRQVVFCLCTSQVITETVTTPDLPAGKLEKLMQANVDMYFPVDVHDYQLVWQVIGPKVAETGAKELAVQLWAVPNGMLARYYQVANGCGLSVAAIDYIGNSVANAIGASFAKPGKFSKERRKLNLNAEISLGKKKQKEEAASAQEQSEDPENAPDTTLHLLVEQDILGMTFVQNGQVMLQRFIRCGSDPVYQFGELAMMLDYFQAMDIGRGSQVQGVVAGTLAEEDSVVQELADVMGIEMTRFEAPYEMGWFLCVGAGSTTLEFGIPSLNKPGTAKRQFQSDLPQYGMLLVGGLAVVGVVMMLLTSRLGWDSDIADLQNQQNMLTLQNAKVAGFADNYYEYESLYEAYSADWDTMFTGLRTNNDNLVKMLEELEELLPENASVTNLQIMADGLNVSFATEDKEDAAYLIMKMRNMQYATPIAFSNLAGGGMGPATTYGSQTEQAPKEGSSVTQGSFDEKAMFDLALGNPDKKELLWDTYGRQPEADSPNNTIAATKEKLPSSSSLRLRARGFKDMLETNPFSAGWFYDLLMADAQNNMTNLDKSILAKHILEDVDMLTLMSYYYNPPKTYDSYQSMLNKLIGVITKTEERMSAAETLMQKNRDMELVYIYHVKMNSYIAFDSFETPYYIHMETMRTDMNAGGSKTGDSTLDTGLNKIFAYLVEQVPGESTDSTVPGETTDTTEPGESTDTTGPDETVDPLDPDAVMAQMMGKFLVDYLKTGTTGNAMADGMIENFLTTGSTGSETIDKAIIEAVKSEVADKELKDLVELYVEHVGSDLEVSTGNPALDEVIKLVNDVVVNGGTGDPAKDEKLKELYKKIDELYNQVLEEMLNPTQPGETTESTEPGVSDSQIGKHLSEFLAKGTTGDEKVDQQIKDFILKGSTGDKDLDKEVEAYINAGKADKELKDLMRAYLKDKKTGNETVDAMMTDLLANKANVNAVLKGRIIKLLQEIAAEVPEVTLEEAIGDYLITFMSNLTTKGSIRHDGLKKDDEIYKNIDVMLRKYLSTETTGKTELDARLNKLVRDGYFDKILKLWLEQYRQGKGISVNEFDGEMKLNAEAVNAIFVSELAGTTPPNKEISKRFGIVWALIAQEAAAKAQGGGGGTPQQAADTRVHFTAILNYNPALRAEELSRKGLNYDDKVKPLEVGE